MSPNKYRTIWLAERTSGLDVRAVMCRHLTPDDLAEAERTWGPLRDRTDGSEHGHWRWDNPGKTNAVARGRTVIVGVSVGGAWQGLMAVDAAARRSRSRVAALAPWLRRSVVYVDYIEAAPWNVTRRPQPDVLQFRGVGSLLLMEAVRLSLEAGHDGRVGLHSLPQSVAFYRNAEMRCLIPDDDAHQGLDYFEYNSATACDRLARFSRDRT